MTTENNKSAISELELKFEEFISSLPAKRKQMIPHLEYLANQAYQSTLNPYAGEKASKFVNECKCMARLRQPSSYNESRSISFAIGDLNALKWSVDDHD